MPDTLTTEFIYFMFIALVVLIIFVTFGLSSDVKNQFSGDRLSGIERVSLNNMQNVQEQFKNTVQCDTSKGYIMAITPSIVYEGSAKDIDIYPVLDFGNNPKLDDAKTFYRCTPGEDGKYTCAASPDFRNGQKQLTFTLGINSIKTTQYFLQANTPVQLYFFKRSPVIDAYIDSPALTHTTPNLLASYADFYRRDTTILGFVDTTSNCLQDIVKQKCEGLDANACDQNSDCYRPSGGACRACTIGLPSCGDYNTDECEKCRYPSQIIGCKTGFEGLESKQLKCIPA